MSRLDESARQIQSEARDALTLLEGDPAVALTRWTASNPESGIHRLNQEEQLAWIRAVKPLIERVARATTAEDFVHAFVDWGTVTNQWTWTANAWAYHPDLTLMAQLAGDGPLLAAPAVRKSRLAGLLGSDEPQWAIQAADERAGNEWNAVATTASFAAAVLYKRLSTKPLNNDVTSQLPMQGRLSVVTIGGKALQRWQARSKAHQTIRRTSSNQTVSWHGEIGAFYAADRTSQTVWISNAWVAENRRVPRTYGKIKTASTKRRRRPR